MTPKEVHEAAALIAKVEKLKNEIKQLEVSIENPLAMTGDIKYKFTDHSLGRDRSSISSAKFMIEGESVGSIITLIRTHLEESVAEAIARLVELGVEAPEDG